MITLPDAYLWGIFYHNDQMYIPDSHTKESVLYRIALSNHKIEALRIDARVTFHRANSGVIIKYEAPSSNIGKKRQNKWAYLKW